MSGWEIFRLEPGHGLGRHALAWDALNERSFHSHPMLASQFIDGLLKHLGNSGVLLCVMKLNDMPHAMCMLRSTGPGLWSTFLPAQAQIGPMLLTDPDHIQSLLPKLPGYAIRVDLLCVDPAFSNFKMDDPLRVNRMDHAHTMNVSLSGTFGNYWASRPKNLIKNLARYQRRSADDGLDQKLVRITEPSEIEAAVDRYAALESSGWKGKEGTALGSSEIQRKFYTELMQRFGDVPRNAIIYELWLGERLAASRLLIGLNDMVVILKTTYDESLSRYAPGRVLLYLVLADLFAFQPGKRVEFYTDADADQLAWATQSRWIAHWTIYRSGASLFLNGLVRAAILTLKPRPTIKAPATDEYEVDVYRGFGDLPADVRAFFTAAEADDFQFGLDWYRNLHETVFAKEDGVYVFCLRQKDKLMACIPLLARKRKLGFAVESLGNFYTTLYSPNFEANVRYNDLVRLIQAIPQTLGTVTSMQFSPMDPEALGYCRLKNSLHAAGLAEFGFFCSGNWFLSKPLSWQSYVAGLRGATRSTIRRMTRKFMDAGGTIQIVTEADGAQTALVAYEKVYASSWKQAEPYPDFIPGLVRLCTEKGWLRLGVASLNGEPVAAQLWVVVNKKANIYKLAYDEAFKQYKPGTVLTAALMEHVIEKDGVQEVDFLVGDDPYKRFWMSDRRERWGIIAYNPRTLGGIIGLALQVGAGATKAARAGLQARLKWLRHR